LFFRIRLKWNKINLISILLTLLEYQQPVTSNQGHSPALPAIEPVPL